jgi:parvulin-like peptidyl-prolyl isomerase
MAKRKITKKLRPFKKKAKEVKDLVPANVVEKAAELNPLNPTVPEGPSLEDVPRITNENISEHREEVLKGARKYIYPLRHSTRTIVLITVSVIIAAFIGLLVYCGFAMYKFYQYNTFIYRVSQVVPFPIAKADGHYVTYENYLFELRRYVHYYQSQRQNNFSGADRDRLLAFRKQALQQVIDDAYIKDVAAKNHVSVSDKEVNARLTEVRNQNRLGDNNKVFADVLREYWGWSVNDFKRSLKQEILAEKVSAKMDIPANQKADSVMAQLKAGADFATVAKASSDEPTAKQTGGDYGFPISKTNPNVSPEVVGRLFQMKKGEVAGPILASPVIGGQGASLQIIKLNTTNGDTVTASHIVVNLQDPGTYIKQLKLQKPPHPYVHF